MRLDYNFCIIINPVGPFGGAQRRFTNLFKYLYEKYPFNSFYIVSFDLYQRILEIYPDFPVNNLIIIGPNVRYLNKNKSISSLKLSTQKKNSYLRDVFRFIKNFKIQYTYFREIENIRKRHNIKLFMGVYSGVLPLYFYLHRNNRKVAIVFSNMDSWFSNIVFSKKDIFLNKYNSFNYALKKSDHVDFLSPFILKGLELRGFNFNENNISVASNSFTDYKKCKIGSKINFEVAFSGRLEKDKNPLLFIEAAKEISIEYPEIIFHIMGEGRLLNEIINSSKGYDSIVVHGFCNEPTNILADCSVFVSIQSTNNYPSQSVLEAMACGCAIIATDVGDTKLFINKYNGLLIQLNKFELIKAIEKLYLEREFTRNLGEVASKYVQENHTIEKTANYYLGMFDKVYNSINK